MFDASNGICSVNVNMPNSMNKIILNIGDEET
jgi:hypothetical protein